MFQFLEVAAVWKKVQELVQDAKEDVSDLYSEPLVRLNQVCLVHLVEGRVKLGALKVLKRTERSQYTLFIF